MSELTDKVMRKIAAMEADGWDMADFRAAIAERDNRTAIRDLVVYYSDTIQELLESINGLEVKNDQLLHACKYAYAYFQAEKESGADYDRKAYLLLEDAIARTALEAGHAD